MLMFHGNAGNIGHRVPIAKILADDIGCNVLMLQYRGYGLSTGIPNEKGLAIDALTGLDYIRQRADLRHTKIVIYGQSLGGAVGIGLAARSHKEGDIAGIILENTFTSIRKLIPRYAQSDIWRNHSYYIQHISACTFLSSVVPPGLAERRTTPAN
jgi:pimeloyl-ACP methyl ester carboxylesterase